MKKLFAVLLCAAMFLGAASGCSSEQGKDTGTGASVSESIAPSEEGWTKQQLLDTAYLCGKKMSFPLTVESLGKDFKLDKKSIEVNSEEHFAKADLLYKGKLLGKVRIENVDSAGGINDGSPLAILLVDSKTCEVESGEPVSVNGVKLGDTEETAQAALGDKYEKSGAVYTFKESGTDGEICKLLFSAETLSTIILNFT